MGITPIWRQSLIAEQAGKSGDEWGHVSVFLLCTAGLRRSFRLSRKEKENVNEGKQAEQDAAEFLTYEEVTKYQQQPGEQQRLVVLIGKIPSWFQFFFPSSLILHFQIFDLGVFVVLVGFLKIFILFLSELTLLF